MLKILGRFEVSYIPPGVLKKDLPSADSLASSKANAMIGASDQRDPDGADGEDLEEFHSSKSGPCSSTRPCPSSKVEWRRNETNSAVTCCPAHKLPLAASCLSALFCSLLSALY